MYLLVVLRHNDDFYMAAEVGVVPSLLDPISQLTRILEDY